MSDADVLFPWENEGGANSDAQQRAQSQEGASVVDAPVPDEAGRDEAGPDEAEPEASRNEPLQEQPPRDAAAAFADDTEAASEAAAGAQAYAGDDADAATSLDQPDAVEAGDVITGESANAHAGDSATDDDSRFDVLDTEYARQAAERASAALREKPVAQKEYYSISEVCELVGLKAHVLRYWETQFQVLNPSKNRSGNRVYQRKEIRLVTLVKHLLYDEKYTVEGAKAKLDRLRKGGDLAGTAGAVLDRAMVDQLRADLSELTTLLTPPART